MPLGTGGGKHSSCSVSPNCCSDLLPFIMAGIFHCSLFLFSLFTTLALYADWPVDGLSGDETLSDGNAFLNLSQTMKYCEENVCGRPVRAFIAVASLRELKHKDGPFYPVGIILHQCRNSGYCSSAYEKCINKSSTPVTFQIQVDYPMGPVYNVTRYNHTHCDCVSDDYYS